MEIKNLVPELNYWIGWIKQNSAVYHTHVDVPVEASKQHWYIQGTALDLLFNPCFNSPGYIARYRRANLLRCPDRPMYTRSRVFAGYVVLYQADTEYHSTIETLGVPPFETDDIYDTTDIGTDETVKPGVPTIDADRIFTYPSSRAYNMLGLTVAETTCLNLLMFQKTPHLSHLVNIDWIDYARLPSGLCKLIYMYIKFEQTAEFTEFTTFTVQDTRLLVHCYHKWLLDHIYRKLKFDTVQSTDEFLFKHNFGSALVEIDEESADLQQYEIPTIIVENNIILFHDGDMKKPVEDFLLTQDSTSTVIDWGTTGMDVEAGDRIYMIYTEQTTQE